ncbi:MAG: hypothetical protein HY675_05405, partial [Chloroflexi bacterium]|nr:hypothetical protein [Chloroflexota bacterium]
MMRSTSRHVSEYEPPLVLAIDIGSSSVRAGLYDARAHVVEGTEVRRDHLLHVSSDGGVEELAEHVQACVEGAVD